MSNTLEGFIPLFPEGKRKAFTLSSDDGVTQDKRLTGLMRKYGIRGTFYLNSGLMGEKNSLVLDGMRVRQDRLKREEINKVYEGFEVAAHTFTHADLTKLSSCKAAYEIEEDKKELEDLLHVPVAGMSYPYGAYNKEVIKIAAEQGMAYARTVKCTGSFDLPEDFLVWNPTCHYRDEKRMDLGKEFLSAKADDAVRGLLCFYVWGHAYQIDAYNDWENLEKFFGMIGRHRDIWYASNLEICAYMQALKNLTYDSAKGLIQNPSGREVWIQAAGRTFCIKGEQKVCVAEENTDEKCQHP